MWASLRVKFISCRSYVGHATELIVALISGSMAYTQLFENEDNLLPADSFQFLTQDQAARIIGLLFATAFVTMVIGMIFREYKYSRYLRRVGMFVAFLCFSYVAFIGFFSDQLIDPVGVLAFGLALISGFLHIQENRAVADE